MTEGGAGKKGGGKPALPCFGQTVEESKRHKLSGWQQKLTSREYKKREILRSADSAQNDGLFKLGSKIQWVRSFRMTIVFVGRQEGLIEEGVFASKTPLDGFILVWRQDTLVEILRRTNRSSG
jgi:hypothetical protein